MKTRTIPATVIAAALVLSATMTASADTIEALYLYTDCDPARGHPGAFPSPVGTTQNCTGDGGMHATAFGTVGDAGGVPQYQLKAQIDSGATAGDYLAGVSLHDSVRITPDSPLTDSTGTVALTFAIDGSYGQGARVEFGFGQYIYDNIYNVWIQEWAVPIEYDITTTPPGGSPSGFPSDGLGFYSTSAPPTDPDPWQLEGTITAFYEMDFGDLLHYYVFLNLSTRTIQDNFGAYADFYNTMSLVGIQAFDSEGAPIDASFESSALLAVVPVPPALALFGGALAALGWLRRRG